MAGFRTGDIAAFQTIEVTADGTRTIAYPVDDEGKRGESVVVEPCQRVAAASPTTGLATFLPTLLAIDRPSYRLLNSVTRT